MNSNFLDMCERLLPPGSVNTESERPVISPADTGLAVEVVRLAAEQRIPLIINGGGTYPLPAWGKDMFVLSTHGIKGEAIIDTDDFVAEVSAGTTVDEAITASESAGMEFPLDLFSGATATVGGAFMTRANGGPRRIGSTFSDSVLGGKFITAAGDIVTAGGRMIKNVTGYDLTRLFAGSMGMFGISTGLYVKLTALREESATIVVNFSDGADAIVSLDELMTATAPDVVQLSAPEGLADCVMIRIRYSGFRNIVESAKQRAGDITSKHHATAIEHMTEEGSRTAIRKSMKPVFGTDTVAALTPPSAIQTALRHIRGCSPDMPAACHVREGRFWFMMNGNGGGNACNAAITSIGGKHPVSWKEVKSQGIAGLYTDAERAIIRLLKHELDPAGIFNPHLAL
jgi:glycolate oxidase FAD binding subunit